MDIPSMLLNYPLYTSTSLNLFFISFACPKRNETKKKGTETEQT